MFLLISLIQLENSPFMTDSSDKKLYHNFFSVKKTFVTNSIQMTFTHTMTHRTLTLIFFSLYVECIPSTSKLIQCVCLLIARQIQLHRISIGKITNFLCIALNKRWSLNSNSNSTTTNGIRKRKIIRRSSVNKNQRYFPQFSVAITLGKNMVVFNWNSHASFAWMIFLLTSTLTSISECIDNTHSTMGDFSMCVCVFVQEVHERLARTAQWINWIHWKVYECMRV